MAGLPVWHKDLPNHLSVILEVVSYIHYIF